MITNLVTESSINLLLYSSEFQKQNKWGRLHFFWRSYGENPFPCLSQLLEASCSVWLMISPHSHMLLSSCLLFSLWPSCLPVIKTCEYNVHTQILNHICKVPLVVSGDMFTGSEDEDVDIFVSGIMLSFKMCSQKRLGRSRWIGEIFKVWN